MGHVGAVLSAAGVRTKETAAELHFEGPQANVVQFVQVELLVTPHHNCYGWGWSKQLFNSPCVTWQSNNSTTGISTCS